MKTVFEVPQSLTERMALLSRLWTWDYSSLDCGMYG